MNPDHTPVEAAHAELERFDRVANALAEAPVHLAAHQLREPLEDVVDIVRAMSGRHATRETTPNRRG